VRKVFLGLSGLLMLAVVAQFYFAATGAFTKPQADDSYALHAMNGMLVIPLLSVLATVAAAVARAPGRLIGFTLLPLGLVIVQVLIVVLGGALTGTTEERTTTGGLVILGLHAINGLAIMAVAGTILRRARLLATAPRGEAPPDAPSDATAAPAAAPTA